MKIRTLLICIFVCITSFINAQKYNNSEIPASINENGSAPDPSAILDVQSDSKGILTPRMSTVLREAISNPAEGLLVFDTDTGGFWYFSNLSWKELSGDNITGAISENQKILTPIDTNKNVFMDIDISGDYAVFGAKGINNNPGVALVYKWNGSRWVEHFELMGATTTGNIEFGNSVSISNEYVAIGSNNKVYIYQREGDSWILQDELIPNNIIEERFGESVDIENDQLIIGSPPNLNDFHEGTIAGAAYIYKKSGNAWVFEAKFTPGLTSIATFGESVSISGELAVVDDSDIFTLSGRKVYLYRKVNNSWVTQTTIDLTTNIYDSSLSIFGDYILVDGYVYYWDGTDLVFDTAFDLEMNSGTLFINNRNPSSLYGNFAININDDFPALASLFERTSNGWKKNKQFKNSGNMDILDTCFENDKIIILTYDPNRPNSPRGIYFFQK